MAKLITPAHPNIPWQDRPESSNSPVWRYDANPILTPANVPHANSVFNSAVVPFGKGFAGVFRCDSRALQMDIFVGFSDDGIKWEISNTPIMFEGVGDAITRKEYRYDPRVIFLEDRYYISWCNGYHGPTIGLGYTFDFKTFYQLENMFLPFNRNGVLFPRQIGDNYAVLSRPSDNGHTPFGDIYYSESPDLTYWGKHRFVMGTTDGWQSTKIGPGPCPLETDEGWLLYYHGVVTTCNGFVYRMGAALLDIDEPWKIIARSSHYLMGPEEDYERTGDVPNVFFPCGVLTDGPTGRIALYYGGADTVVGIAFTDVDSTLEYLWKHNIV